MASGGHCLVNTNQQCAAAEKKPNEILGYIKMESPALIEVVFIPLGTCEATPGILCCLVPTVKKNVDRLQRIQRRTTKRNRGLGGLPCEERL